MTDPALKEVISTAEAAKIAGMTDGGIKYAIAQGFLHAKKVGHSWVLNRATVKAFAKIERKRGPKAKV